jgi:hypothetical protein
MIVYRWWFKKGVYPPTQYERWCKWEGWFLFGFLPLLIRQVSTILEGPK